MPQGGSEDEGLYHVTTALDKIINEGLKSRKQTGTIGLGGGGMNVAPDKISATYDAGHAAMIEDRLRLAVRAARGELTPSQALEQLMTQAGIDDDTPETVWRAMPISEPSQEALESWDEFNKAVDDRYGKWSAYEAVQDLDDALPGIFSGEEYSPVRVGLTATRAQMAKIDPSQIGTVRVEGRKGATVDHQPEEAELRFRPEDIRVHPDDIAEHLTKKQ